MYSGTQGSVIITQWRKKQEHSTFDQAKKTKSKACSTKTNSQHMVGLHFAISLMSNISGKNLQFRCVGPKKSGKVHFNTCLISNIWIAIVLEQKQRFQNYLQTFSGVWLFFRDYEEFLLVWCLKHHQNKGTTHVRKRYKRLCILIHQISFTLPLSMICIFQSMPYSGTAQRFESVMETRIENFIHWNGPRYQY